MEHTYENIYAYRGVGEGMFGALTVEFGDRLKTRREESTKARTLLKDHDILPKDHSEVGL
jgi:hypothetical protein